MRERILDDIRNRRTKVAVIGLGYVGLPLAVEFARSGFPVIGIEIDGRKAKSINESKSYVEDISDNELREVVEKGLLRATTDYSEVKNADAIIITVPTPLSKTKDPDLSYIMSAIESIKPHLKKGHIIVLESTTYPGTTDEVVKPELETTGLKVGEDIFLAFSPERINPGDKKWKFKNTPKVLGGVDPVSTEVAAALYGQVLDHLHVVSSAKVAETAKLLENTFRAINIALVNELAIMCNLLGIDVWEVIDAAATKPFGFMKFTPGPGIGGHCIPIDPLYLSWKLKTLNYNARMIEVASEINTNMPRYVVSRVQDILNDMEKSVKGSRILVVGVAYKKDVSDTRESPALDVIALLEEKGAKVDYHDPHVPSIRIGDREYSSVDLNPDRIKDYDLVVITTDHSSIDWKTLQENARIIFDTKNVYRSGEPNVIKL